MKRKLLSFTLITILIFVQSVDFTSSQSNSILTLEKYDIDSDEWTKLILTDLDYIIESENSYIDQLEGTLMTDPWYAINSGANESGFLYMDFDELNSTYILKIESDWGENEIRINEIFRHWSAELSPFLDLVDSIFDRLTGNNIDGGIWPVDISVAIMESYPEQYGVDVTFQRGGDMLTVVQSISFALVISDVFDPDNSYEPNWILNASMAIWGNVSLASGGNQVVYNFPTFIFGTETDYDNLGFMVLLESGTFFKSHPQEGALPFIGSVDPLVYEDLELFASQFPTVTDSFPTVPAFLPFPWFMSIISIIAIPIIRKKYSN